LPKSPGLSGGTAKFQQHNGKAVLNAKILIRGLRKPRKIQRGEGNKCSFYED
jgi:hypothetical protein